MSVWRLWGLCLSAAFQMSSFRERLSLGNFASESWKEQCAPGFCNASKRACAWHLRKSCSQNVQVSDTLTSSAFFPTNKAANHLNSKIGSWPLYDCSPKVSPRFHLDEEKSEKRSTKPLEHSKVAPPAPIQVHPRRKHFGKIAAMGRKLARHRSSANRPVSRNLVLGWGFATCIMYHPDWFLTPWRQHQVSTCCKQMASGDDVPAGQVDGRWWRKRCPAHLLPCSQRKQRNASCLIHISVKTLLW